MGKRQWWNGKWGRLARRDVIIHHQPEHWRVEARAGGAEGKSTFIDATDELDAEQTANRLMATEERWRELT